MKVMIEVNVISSEDLRIKLNALNGMCINMKALGVLSDISQQHMSGFMLGKRNMSDKARARIETALAGIVKELVR